MPAPPVDSRDSLTTTPWTPACQMANLLLLCEAQMNSALQEADQSVDALVQVFTQLATAMRGLEGLGSESPVGEKTRPASNLGQDLSRLAQQVNSAIVALQFYDKLTQRLGHVCYSLNSAAEFVRDPQQAQQPDQWRRLHAGLRSRYRTAEERQIFHLMMDPEHGTGGGSTNQPMTTSRASGEVHPHVAAAQQAGDIELF